MDAIICRLCGYEYTRSETTCAACPLACGDHPTCCPRCGYQNIGDSKLLGFFERILGGVKKRKRGRTGD